MYIEFLEFWAQIHLGAPIIVVVQVFQKGCIYCLEPGAFKGPCSFDVLIHGVPVSALRHFHLNLYCLIWRLIDDKFIEPPFSGEGEGVPLLFEKEVPAQRLEQPGLPHPLFFDMYIRLFNSLRPDHLQIIFFAIHQLFDEVWLVLHRRHAHQRLHF